MATFDKFVHSKYLGPAAILFVIGLLFATPMTFNSCTGKPVLHLGPSNVLSGQDITAYVSGLINCKGQKIVIARDSCEILSTSYYCDDSVCSNTKTFALGAPNTYKIIACIDKDGDGRYLSTAERAYAYVSVADQPDLTFGVLSEKISTRAGVVFAVQIPVKNAGTKIVYETVLTYKLVNSKGSSTGEQYLTVKQIDAGKINIVALPSLTLTKGTYKLELELDKPLTSGDKIKEFDETNNKATIPIEIA